ncbi:unnamed protein product, partial [Gulo gulo]
MTFLSQIHHASGWQLWTVPSPPYISMPSTVPCLDSPTASRLADSIGSPFLNTYRTTGKHPILSYVA